MNIHTVRDNLKNTIAGKEKMLKSQQLDNTKDMPREKFIATEVTRTMIEINIGELKRILADVEKCCEKATEDSWALNPDRMGR